MAQSQQYTDADRVRVLAALELHAGNVSRTAEETGVSRLTIRRWRTEVEGVGGLIARPLTAQVVTTDELPPLTTLPVVTAEKPPRDWLAIFGAALDLAVRTVRERLPNMSGRDAAIAMGILADKYLDFRDGRKSAVAVDHSQHLTVPPGTTLDDLRALRDGLRQ